MPLGGAIDNITGVSDLGGGMVISSLTGNSILIGSIVFECLAPGVSSLTMGDFNPDAPLFDGMVAGDGTVYDGAICFGSAAVTQVVPITGDVWLLGSGLFGLVGLKRRRS